MLQVRNGFWGLLLTRPLYLQLSKRAETQRFQEGKLKDLSGSDLHTAHVGDQTWASQQQPPPTVVPNTILGYGTN